VTRKAAERTAPSRAELDRGIAAATAALLSARRADGSWRDTLPSSPSATGSAIIALHIADPQGSACLIAAGAAWLRQAQGADGGWGDAPGAAATLNGTAIAVAALVIVAADESGLQIKKGLECICRFGGVAAVGDKRKCSLRAVCQHYLYLAGLYPSSELTAIPIELALVPARLRQKLSFTVPGAMSWGVMQARTGASGPMRRAIKRVAELAALAYLDWIQGYEGHGGGFEESPLMVSIVCVGVARAGVAPQIARRCVDYLSATTRPDGSWPVNRDLELSATTFVAIGLQESGVQTDQTSPTLSWIRRCQRGTPFMPTGCPAGGWGWSLPSGWPNADDTADALIALAGFGLNPADDTIRRGIAWLLRMQNKNGSWSCFCRDTPFSLDSPCAVMTSHAVTALRVAGGHHAADRPMARAVRWFASVQHDDGAMGCIWYAGLTAGTGCVLDALGGLGLSATPTAQRCMNWLLVHQGDDGGWGAGQGKTATVEETAWAMLGLLGADLDPRHTALRRAASWLLSQQQPDGLWAPALLGVYFLDLLYTCDHLANGYALQALGRYRHALGSVNG